MRILAENIDLPEPLLRDSKVHFDYDVIQDPGNPAEFLVDRDTVRLKLPAIPAQDARKLPKRFDLRVVSPIEDLFGRAGKISFLFDVRVQNELPEANGLVDLEATSTVKEIRDVSRG
jgi:hypothetical protein